MFKQRTIKSAYPVRGKHLILEFNNGEYRTVDITSFLNGPVFEPLRDPEVFRMVKVDSEAGTIVWPNGADLDPNVLYRRSVPLRLRSRKTKRNRQWGRVH